jgi:hypothetical protein
MWNGPFNVSAPARLSPFSDVKDEDNSARQISERRKSSSTRSLIKPAHISISRRLWRTPGKRTIGTKSIKNYLMRKLLESMQAVVQADTGQERAEADDERVQCGGRLGSEMRAV